MRLPKLGQKFWIREIRSDFECKVIGVKKCEFLDGTKFTDLLVEKVRLNDFHIAFYPVEKRTDEKSFRYTYDDKEFLEWHEPRSWPGEIPGEWALVKGKILLKKPKNLRKCEYTLEDFEHYEKHGY